MDTCVSFIIYDNFDNLGQLLFILHLTSKYPSHSHTMGLQGRCTGRLADGRAIRLPSRYPPFFDLSPSLYQSWEYMMVKMGGRREGEPMSIPWLQPFLHKGLRGVTGGREGSFGKLIFSSLQSHHATQRYYTCRPKVLYLPPETFRRIVRRYQTVRPKASDS